jgi:hypothetical protein
MANVNRPAGLSPVQYLNGSPFNGQGHTYYIPSTDTNAYAIGDPMMFAGSADARGVASVTVATAGTTNMVLGSLLGMGGTVNGATFADPTNLNTTIIPATKTQGYYVMVADDPNIIFEVQEIGTGTVFTAAEVGLNCSLVASAGANNTGHNGFVSGWLLDNSTEATTAALQMRILGLAQRSDNVFGQYAKYLCLINNHAFKAGQAGL